MTVATQTTRNDAVGNGSANVYSYGFKIFINTELLVTVADTAGVETTLVLTTDYTVAGVGETSGGSITLVNNSQAWLTGGFLKTGYAITIRRNAALTQQTSVRNQTEFFAHIHEDKFDLLTMLLQQQQDLANRSLRTQETEVGTAALTVLPPLATRKGKLLGFNATTGNLETNATAGTATTTHTTSNKNMTASVTTSDNDQATATAIAATPTLNSMVMVYVNGLLYRLGSATKVGVDSYFSGDGGLTARAISDITAGDTYHWNGSVAGFQLSAADRIDFDYVV